MQVPNGLGGEQFFQRHAKPPTSSLLEAVTVFSTENPTCRSIEWRASQQSLGSRPLSSILGTVSRSCRRCPVDWCSILIPDRTSPFQWWSKPCGKCASGSRRSALSASAKRRAGRGLHVVKPLSHSNRSMLTWPEAKAFAREVCIRGWRAINPQHHVVDMAKRLRSGRNFLDYLRSDRVATAVAPLSRRARIGATVSMPLTWRR
jgi:bifunctional non-homologous end joining protein LigD